MPVRTPETPIYNPGLTGVLGVLSDATKSVSRAYINNFQDKGKQIAIDIFLVAYHLFIDG